VTAQVESREWSWRLQIAITWFIPTFSPAILSKRLPHERRTAAWVQRPNTYIFDENKFVIPDPNQDGCDGMGVTGQFKVTKAHPITATPPDPKASFSIPEIASCRRRPPGGWDLLRAPVCLFAANGTTREIFNILPMRCLSRWVRLLPLAFD